MAAQSSPNPKKKTLAQQLADLSKATLYKWAKEIDIPGRSAMVKEELIAALAKKASQIRKFLASVAPAEDEKKPSPKKTFPKAAKPKTPKRQPVPQEKKEPVAPTATPQVWQGEEGPELPQTYSETTLRAMTKNSHTVYVYWDIDNQTREQVVQTTPHSQTPPEAVLRVYGLSEKPSVEIPVPLQAHHAYIELKPDRTYAFEIGIGSGEKYRTLVRSNLITLPSEPMSLDVTGLNVESGRDTTVITKTATSSWEDASGTPPGKEKTPM